MKLVTFSHNGWSRVGVVDGEEVVDLAVDPDQPRDMITLLEGGDAALASVAAVVAGGEGRMPLSDVKLEAPVRPRKIIAIGVNYQAHDEEMRHVSEADGRQRPEAGFVFTKQASCINGPGDPIYMPRISNKLDYEGELAVVIGKRCRHVPKERAEEVIAGYTVANDVSVRDLGAGSGFSFTLTKSYDTHGPLGPWIVTRDEVDDPHNLTLKTWLNDEQRQNSNTSFMTYNTFELIERVSRVFTLEPGDVIETGTPGGVGYSFKPTKFMKVGDVVRIEIEKVGVLENTVIEEPADTVRIG